VSRLPLIDSNCDDEAVAVVFRRFHERGVEPPALYQALANAPDLLRPYADLAAALRFGGQTPGPLRELAILRTAQLTDSTYEWAHHVPVAREVGVSPTQIAELRDWRDSAEFSRDERAVLACTDELHQGALSDSSYVELQALFEPGEIVELVMLVAFYQAVARMISGLGVELESGSRHPPSRSTAPHHEKQQG
jgi:4-carboxymuconolactone decarboxylase